MSTWTDEQHTHYAQKRQEWFETRDRTWLCADCGKCVEYAPDEPAHSRGSCDHTAYCARCVRDDICNHDEDADCDPETVEVFTKDGRVALLCGLGAQSYAAHVAAGTLR